MSLILDLLIEKDLTKQERFVVKDQTVWGVETAERNTRNLILLVDRFQHDKYVPVESEKITPDADPKNVTEWVLDTIGDGYFKILAIAAPDHNPALAYTKNKLVYGGGKLYVSLDDNVPAETALDDAYFWFHVTSTEDVPVMEETGAELLIKNHVHDLASRLCIAEKALKYASNTCDCPDEEVIDDYIKSLLYHHAAVYSGAFSEFEESGKFLDQVIDRCTNGSASDKDCGCNG